MEMAGSSSFFSRQREGEDPFSSSACGVSLVVPAKVPLLAVLLSWAEKFEAVTESPLWPVPVERWIVRVLGELCSVQSSRWRRGVRAVLPPFLAYS